MICRVIYPTLAALAVVLAVPSPTCPAAPPDNEVVLSAQSRRLLSQLQSMSHGSHPAAEWDAVIEDIHASIERAEQAGDAEEMVSITLILADVYSEMLGNHRQGLKVLTDLQEYLEEREAAGMPRIYAGLAEVYARMGDEAAILALIEEFKAGRHYDPRPHRIEGGEDPSVPITITRPRAAGDDSLTITMMRRSAREARLAVGRTFPDFKAVDTAGRPVALADYRGRVVLLDFWVRGWRPWQDRLPVVRDLYRGKRGEGFAVLGVCLEPRPEGLGAFLEDKEMTWRQVAGNTTLPGELGVGGSATSFLLDRDGRIVGRNLSGGDLTAAVDRLLESQ